MQENDVPKRVVFVLLILAVIVSFIGTLTFLEVSNSVPKAAPPEDVTQGTVSLRILAPNTLDNGPEAKISDAKGMVSVIINKSP